MGVIRVLAAAGVAIVLGGCVVPPGSGYAGDPYVGNGPAVYSSSPLRVARADPSYASYGYGSGPLYSPYRDNRGRYYRGSNRRPPPIYVVDDNDDRYHRYDRRPRVHRDDRDRQDRDRDRARHERERDRNKERERDRQRDDHRDRSRNSSRNLEQGVIDAFSGRRPGLSDDCNVRRPPSSCRNR